METVMLPASGATRKAVPEDEDEDRCAVCFEEGDSFVDIACRCKLRYCMPCWDRSLATSIIVRGRPRCPSCRTAFSVDFDPVLGQLVCAVEDDTCSTKAPLDRQGQGDLYAKVRPLQIQKLKEFGSVATSRHARCAPSECSGPDARKDGQMSSWSPYSRQTAPTDHAQACAHGAEAGQPTCVCGGELERLSLRSRILRMLEEQSLDWRSDSQEAVLDKLVSIALVTCDLCGEEAMRSGAVWTCSRGQHTLLHPSAYDVCEGCFQKHTGLDGQLPKPSRHCRRSPSSALNPSAPWQWLKKQMGACRRHPIVSQLALS